MTILQLAICNRDHCWAVDCKLFIANGKLQIEGDTELTE